MKNHVKLSLLGILTTGTLYLNSCQKVEECKQCSGTMEIIQNGQLTGTQSISAIEYCGEDLQQIESNPVITTTQSIMGFTQESVTTYTCQ